VSSDGCGQQATIFASCPHFWIHVSVPKYQSRKQFKGYKTIAARFRTRRFRSTHVVELKRQNYPPQ
jgi:hypothetical protein